MLEDYGLSYLLSELHDTNNRFLVKMNLFKWIVKLNFKVYVRSVADNIQSEAEQVKVVCGEPVSTGKMCLAKAPKATNVDLARNNVEINLGNHLSLNYNV